MQLSFIIGNHSVGVFFSCSLSLFPQHTHSLDHVLTHSYIDTYLETDTGDITYSVSLTTETRNQDIIVDINVVEATIAGDEGGNGFTILDQVYLDTLTDS